MLFAKCIRVIAVTVCLLVCSSPVLGQDAAGPANYERALEAKQQGAYDDALQLLEQAYIADARPAYLYERILVLEAMGEHRLALDLLEAHRTELAGAEDVGNLMVVEQRLQETLAQTSSAGGRGDADILGWSMVGGGTAFVAGGVVALVVGEANAERLRCSEQSTADKSGCGGVDAYEDLTAEEFDSKRGEVTLYRAVGAGATVIGAGALGYGLFRLLGSERSEQAAATNPDPQWQASVGPRGDFSVAVRFSF